MLVKIKLNYDIIFIHNERRNKLIDFTKARNSFEEYLNDYDRESGMVKLKIAHTYGVVRLSEYIATELNLSDCDIELAKLIGLLHDIARFEQIKEFGDFRDYKSLDHADLGVRILFEDGLIRKFIDTDEFDHIISAAIKNHNKLEIEDGLDELELLHAKIIRDADKADNFRVKTFDPIEDIFSGTKEELENSVITDKIYNDFMSSKTIINYERVTLADEWISYLALLFGFYFTPGLKYIKEHDFVNKIIDRVDYKNSDIKLKMEKIRKHTLKYLDNLLSINSTN